MCAIACVSCTGHTSTNVAEAVRYSEESRTKCIGLTIETRPDYCLGPHLSDMLSYGCTRLEIGLQVQFVGCVTKTRCSQQADRQVAGLMHRAACFASPVLAVFTLSGWII